MALIDRIGLPKGLTGPVHRRRRRRRLRGLRAGRALRPSSRRTGRSSSSRATASACRPSPRRWPSPRPNCRCSSCRPGTACPTTASRPAPTPRRGGSTRWRRWPRSQEAAPRRRPDHRQRAAAAHAAARASSRRRRFRARPGNQIDMNALIARLENSGFERVPTVREVGEFAVRGGILDLFAPGAEEAAAARFLRRHAGDRSAPSTPATQRTTGQRKAIDAAADERGDADAGDDQPLPPQLHRGVRRAVARRCALRRGQRRPALRRHGALAAVLLRAARHAVRLSARRAGRLRPSGARGARRAPHADRRLLRGAPAAGATARCKDAVPYKPVPPDAALSVAGRGRGGAAGPRGGRVHAVRRAGRRRPQGAACRRAGRAAASPPSAPTRTSTSSTRRSSTSPTMRAAKRTRRRRLLDRRLARPAGADARRARPRQSRSRSRRWPRSRSSSRGRRALAVLPLETGFETDALRRHRRAGHPRRPAGAAARRSASAPPTSSPRRRRSTAGDLVVHVDHGIGRFIGLKTIEAAGAPHDCLEIHYAGDDQLYPAGREHRAAVALRLRRRRGRARQARRRRLAGAQGAG